jgi:hypothetical protein
MVFEVKFYAYFHNLFSGWELSCPLREEEDNESSEEAVYEDDPLAPLIYRLIIPPFISTV